MSQSTNARYNAGILEYYDRSSQERVRAFAPVFFEDDFLTPSLVIPAGGSLESGVNWAKKIVGAAPPTVAGVANDVNGTLKCALTSTSEKQNADLYFADQLVFAATQGLNFECRLNVSTIPTLLAESVWGVVSAWADGPDNITYSAFFTADGSGEIFCETDDNVTDASTTSGITVVAGDYHIYRIDFSDTANIKFFIDGNQVASSTTFGWTASAANSKVQPIVSCYKASGAAVGDVTTDYVRVWQKRS
jgi:hypothetical protein